MSNWPLDVVVPLTIFRNKADGIDMFITPELKRQDRAAKSAQEFPAWAVVRSMESVSWHEIPTETPPVCRFAKSTEICQVPTFVPAFGGHGMALAAQLIPLIGAVAVARKLKSE